MTTAKNKKTTAARKRGSAPRKNSAPGSSRLQRFGVSALASALTSFLIASCSLHPHSGQQLEQLSRDALTALQARLEPPPAAPAAPGRAPSAQAGAFAACPQFFPGGKAPALQPQPHERALCFNGFAVLHSGATKTPIFVAERLNRQLLQQGQGLERTDKFYADARLPRAERSELDDYRRSGYSRGHMAPAADMSTPEAMAQSFSLANMVPQNQVHNAGPWSQVEQATRKYAMRARGDVYVFTGPVFAPDAPTIGPGKVAVPEHLFKLVYDASTGKSWAYWQANSADTRMSPPISYEEFTRRTGMPLLPGL